MPAAPLLADSVSWFRGANLSACRPVLGRQPQPVLEDPLSDSEGIFQISCQSLTNAFPFSQESRRKQKKQDPFCTKTRLTRYLRNQISQNCTKESQKWLYSLPAAPFWGTNLRPASAAPFWGANVCRPAGAPLAPQIAAPPPQKFGLRWPGRDRP